MRPHMREIARTLVRKDLVEQAGNKRTSYQRYKLMVADAFDKGHSREHILEELEAEMNRIKNDKREGDALFQQGVHNSKISCLNALNLIISELKGETNNGILYSES